MISYQELEKAVYNFLKEKHEKDTNFTFSVRRKASKGAERDIFIGTEKSGYFGTTFWKIPVAFPGSSGDCIDLFFFIKDNSIEYKFEFTQTDSPHN